MKRSVLFCQRDFGAFAQELHRAAYSPNVNNQRVNAIATMSVGTNRSDTFPADWRRDHCRLQWSGHKFDVLSRLRSIREQKQ